MKAAIITGVSRGLGEALAFQLLDKGYHVWGLSRSAPEMVHDHFRFISADFASFRDSDFDGMWDELLEAAPKEVLLLNNAGVIDPVGAYETHRAPMIEKTLSCNVVAPMALTAELLRRFADKGTKLKIVNISSGAAVHILPGLSVYSISKNALEFATKGLVEEEKRKGRDNVSCLIVRPGIIDTKMQSDTRSLDPNEFESQAMFSEFKESGGLRAAEDVASDILELFFQDTSHRGLVYSLPKKLFSDL